MHRTYADQFIDWLVDDGYDTCFFLAGGNIMHLLNSARTRLRCIPVIHEVAAGIATEYFNASRPEGSGKAFALVTAGPGVTNIVTAMAGAFLESRELLVVAGQVKSSDLSDSTLRQRGIQEVDACALAAPVTKATLQIASPVSRETVLQVVHESASGRPGPVLIDFCLDAQAAPPSESGPEARRALPEGTDIDLKADSPCSRSDVQAVLTLLRSAQRPVVLLGGGVSRSLANTVLQAFEQSGLPVATTWNALDRVPDDSPVYFGRPDTWGMRWANVLLQQADVVIAVGARLSLQQTGFNWQSFTPLAQVIHVDIDPAELAKSHPLKARTIRCRSESFLPALVAGLGNHPDWSEWLAFGQFVRRTLPLNDPHNQTAHGFISPYEFAEQLSIFLGTEDVLIPCSSGGASTVLMQAFRQKQGQLVVNNKALASMGYGLSGAIGAALANPDRRVTLVEGDGGFAQNVQELGTVQAQNLRVKAFIFSNSGYASIRMTQRNYFGGAYVGCDSRTFVGLPDWHEIAAAYGIPAVQLTSDKGVKDTDVVDLMNAEGPSIFIVPVDPEQTYYPKISSRVAHSGEMESSPLHIMSPDLPPSLAEQVLPYLGRPTHESD